jgi:nitrate/TMAO reductase-like tetraheme cytochrome c subunit
MKSVGKFCALAIVVFMLSWTSLARAQHKPKDAECLACHADPTLTTTDASGKTVSLTVDAEKLKQSVHGGMFSCVDCHKDVKSSPPEATPAQITCAQCHADQQAAYKHSFHATAKKPDGSPAATCVDCHGDAHTILPASDPKSPVSHSNIPATCGSCHGQKLLMQSTGGSSQVFVAYQDSVHGRAVKNGSQTAAVCTDCHGSHQILPANDARSLVNKFNVPATCRASTCRAFTGRRSCAATASPRSARTATESTPSRRPPIPTRRPPMRICRAPPARAVTRACG